MTSFDQPAALEQILRLQALLPVSSDLRRIGELCCITLASMPGVDAVGFRPKGEGFSVAADRGGLLADAYFDSRLQVAD